MSGTPFFQPDSPLGYMAAALGDGDTVNMNLIESNVLAGPSAEPAIPHPPTASSASPTADANENQLTHPVSDSGGTQSADASGPAIKDTPEDNHNNNHTSVTDTQPSPVPDTHSSAEQETIAKSGTLSGISPVSLH